MAPRFRDYAEMIAELFRTKTRDVSVHARHYLAGLLSQIPRKNMERMGEVLADTKHEDLQNFLSDSPWGTARVWQWVGQAANTHLGGRPDTMLLIDESGFAKKGPKSAGVARQHNGRLGKTDNCQVGVFSALALGSRVTLVGARLFLPDEWVEDRPRCLAAGIPEADIQARSKLDLARELVAEAQANQVAFAWVGVDSFYGRDQDLLCWLADTTPGFVADVPCDLLVWTHAPTAKTRPAPLRAAGAERVDAVAARWRKAGSGQAVRLRGGENGPVRVRVWAQQVWVWPAGQAAPRCWWLVVRPEPDGTNKYTLCNAPARTSLARLARLQGQRHFIERGLQDGKSELGMSQYQARKWRAWHHHMALVGLAMFFVFTERLRQKERHPLLSTRDVVELLDWYFCGARGLAEIEAVVQRRLDRRARLAAAAAARANKLARKAQIKVPK